MRRERGRFCVITAFPDAQGPSQKPTRRRKSPLHAPWLSFSVRRDRVVTVDTGLWARRGGAAARGSRGICQYPILACSPRNDIFATKRSRKADAYDAAGGSAGRGTAGAG